MHFLKSTVGRKLVMAVSGTVLLVFVVVHLLGNTTIYSGPDGINAYARALRSLGPLLWAFRLILVAMFILHVFYGIQLTLENRAAKPEAYAVRKHIESTFSSITMIWTGLLIGAFIVYHLLHFTFQVTNPGISASRHPDALGRPDVFTMVLLSFRKFFVSLIYVGALGALGLHLLHSIEGSFQTVGLNSDRTFPVIRKGGRLAALLIYFGYISIPIVILAGILG
ncbi:MAG: succinate dehydrogenase cytochrome b subunit [Nitrospirae bacterium]|nr:succinate dehydrogenase cytochrome b subunit [Nitrospirota bacterium]